MNIIIQKQYKWKKLQSLTSKVTFVTYNDTDDGREILKVKFL